MAKPNEKMAVKRLDVVLLERGLAESRARAQALILAGRVRVAGEMVTRPAARVSMEAAVSIDPGPRFVSRGGEKLEAALTAFPVSIRGRVCADVGASTGGFTDCLLQHGAARVYAVDVGSGLLDWRLRQDPRVVVLEKTNARYLERLAEPVSLVTIDVSFISLKVLLPVVAGWFPPEPALGEMIALVKPQFEAGRQEAARGRGVIRDAAIHARVLCEVMTCAARQGFGACGLIRSPRPGPKGNVEFLLWLVRGEKGQSPATLLTPLGLGQPVV